MGILHSCILPLMIQSSEMRPECFAVPASAYESERAEALLPTLPYPDHQKLKALPHGIMVGNKTIKEYVFTARRGNPISRTTG